MSKKISIATGVPSFKHDQSALFDFADKIYCKDETESRKLKFLYNHSGIEHRYSVIPDYSVAATDRKFFPPATDLEPFPGIEERMRLFNKHAAQLSVTTIEDCIRGKIGKDEITPKVKALFQGNPDLRIYINADTDAKHGMVIEVLDCWLNIP